MIFICILTLCGLPGAGKTSFVSSFKKFISTKSTNWAVIHVCYDHLIPQNLYKNELNFNSKTDAIFNWKSYRLLILKCLEKLMISLKISIRTSNDLTAFFNNNFPSEINPSTDDEFKTYNHVKKLFLENVTKQLKAAELIEKVSNENGCNSDVTYIIVLDDNMWLRSMRYQVCQVARKCNCSLVHLYFPISATTSLKRNANRNQEDQISDLTIDNMALTLEKPDSIYNKWEKFTYIWDFVEDGDIDINMDEKLSQLKSMLDESILNPCEIKHNDDDDELIMQSRLATLTNVIHQSDVILRKLLSNQMASLVKDKNQNKKDVAAKAKIYNDVKNSIRMGIKSGSIFLPILAAEDIEGSAVDEESCLYKYLKHLFFKKLIDGRDEDDVDVDVTNFQQNVST